DGDNPTDPALELMASGKKALAKIGNPRYQSTHPLVYGLGGFVLGIEIDPGTVRPSSPETSAKAFFWMRVILKFYADVNDPFDYGRSFVPDPPTPCRRSSTRSSINNLEVSSWLSPTRTTRSARVVSSSTSLPSAPRPRPASGTSATPRSST